MAPEVERLAASVLMDDGQPRFIWTDTKTDPIMYATVIVESVIENSRWKAQYQGVRTRSATAADPDG